ncbi:MAG: hypothetical protein PHP17_05850 [Candidatus Omnitrophica bacterium]|nr:hypothetical protein [Candidatus Omnitrophota bacterium]
MPNYMMHKAIYLILAFCFCQPVFAEAPEAPQKSADTSRDALARSIEEAVKKAIKDVEAQNAKEREVNARELSLKLVSAMDGWFSGVNAQRTKELNKLQHRDWSELKKFPSPLPYDFYLKNFSYILQKSDIALTDSIVNPYKAFVRIEERLFVEGYHSTDAAYLEQYHYTVITPIDLQLEYRDNMFTIVETRYGQPIMERGWKK